MVVELSPLLIFNFVVVSVVFCTYFSVSIKWILQLYSHKHDIYMQKRMVPIQSVVSMVLLMGSLSFFHVTRAIGDGIDPIFFSWIGRFLFATSFCFFAHTLLCSNWMIFFLSHWAFNNTYHKWKCILKTDAKHNTFYEKYHTTLGNKRFITRLFGGMCAMLAVLHDIFAFLNYLYPAFIVVIYITLTMVTSAALFYAVIVCKMQRKFNDKFFIYWEAKIHRNLFILSAVHFLILKSMSLMVYIPGEIYAMVFFPLVQSLVLAMVYTSTVKIMSKNIKNGNYDLNTLSANTTAKANGHSNSRSSVHHSSSAMNGEANSSAMNLKKLTLKHVLSNALSLNAFMKHLNEEFSAECMLSMIEIQQFQKHVLTRMNTVKDSKRNNNADTNINTNTNTNKTTTAAAVTSVMSESCCNNNDDDDDDDDDEDEDKDADEQPTIAMNGDNTTSKSIHLQSRMNLSLELMQSDAKERSELEIVFITFAPNIIPQTSIVTEDVFEMDTDAITHKSRGLHVGNNNSGHNSNSNSGKSPNSNRSAVELARNMSFNQMQNDVQSRMLFECKLRALRIYLKYIRNGCEYEVNLSHQQRYELSNLMEDRHAFLYGDNSKADTLRKLLFVFNDTRKEMQKVLTYSFVRFKYTDECQEILHLFRHKDSSLELVDIHSEHKSVQM